MKEEVEESCLCELKELIKGSGDTLLQSVLDDDQFLRIFVIGRKYNVQYAFETVKGYMKVKYLKYAEIYQMEPHSVEHVLRSGMFGTFRHKDHRNRIIGFIRFSKVDIKTFGYMDIIRALTLMVEASWRNLDYIRTGQVLLADFTGYNWSIMRRYTIGQKLMLMDIFLRNHPARVKGLHILFNPRLFGIAYPMIRPFLPDKLKKRLQIHGKELESFHQFVSPDILPVWLGGKLSDEEAIDLDLIERILQS